MRSLGQIPGGCRRGALLAALARRSPLSLPLPLWLGQYLLIGNLLLPVGVYAASRLMPPFTLAAAAALALGATRLERAPVLWVAALALVVPLGLEVRSLASRWVSLESAMRVDLEQHPRRPTARLAYAKALFAAGRFAEARPLLVEAVGRWPSYVEARILLADTCSQLADRPAARAQLSRVLELTSRRSPVLDQLRLHALITLAVFDRVSDRDRSERYLRQAEALAPRDWRVMHNQAILAVRDEDWPEAGRRFRRLLSEHSEFEEGRRERDQLVKAFYDQGGEMSRAGRITDALVLFGRVLLLHPAHASARFNRALLLAKVGRAKEAFEEYTLSLLYLPTVRAYFNRANLALQMGRSAQALADYERVLLINPFHVGSLARRGDLHAAQGRPPPGPRRLAGRAQAGPAGGSPCRRATLQAATAIGPSLGLPRRAHRYSRAPRAEPPQQPLHGMLCAGETDEERTPCRFTTLTRSADGTESITSGSRTCSTGSSPACRRTTVLTSDRSPPWASPARASDQTWRFGAGCPSRQQRSLLCRRTPLAMSRR
jgi:tetratricopeptide (TPR) repeat protein